MAVLVERAVTGFKIEPLRPCLREDGGKGQAEVAVIAIEHDNMAEISKRRSEYAGQRYAQVARIDFRAADARRRNPADRAYGGANVQ